MDDIDQPGQAVQVWRSPDDVLDEAIGMINEWRAEARARRRNRRIVEGIAAFFAVFLASLGVVLMVQNESQPAAAQEPVAPLRPVTTEQIVPEVAPTSTMPQAIKTRVIVPGWDGQGQLVTDGVQAPYVMPGDPCRSIIAIPFDPTLAGTFYVAIDQRMTEWRVQQHGKVDANGLRSLTDRCAIEPTVIIVSGLPGDKRPYVEGTR